MSAVYLVKTPSGDRLVEAGSKTVAINHAVKSEIECRSVTASELIQLMNQGMVVEQAGKKTETGVAENTNPETREPQPVNEKGEAE